MKLQPILAQLPHIPLNLIHHLLLLLLHIVHLATNTNQYKLQVMQQQVMEMMTSII